VDKAAAVISGASGSTDAESETPSHIVQRSAACEKPRLVNAAAFASSLSVSSDAESETPSHTMQQSAAWEKPHLKGRKASTASTILTPSLTAQQSASSGSGGAVGPSQTAESVLAIFLRRDELTNAELLQLTAEQSSDEVAARAAAQRARFGG